MKKKIIVADDEPLIPILMKEIIEENEDLELTKIANGKSEFAEMLNQQSFDAALIDISIEGREGGIELLKMMHDRSINLPTIMLSAHDELHYALRCLQAGAKGYINKKYICTDVVKCLKEVLDGHLFVSGDKGEQILKEYRKSKAPLGTESR